MFFTYLLKDPRNMKAFYIGKGQGDRPLYHLKEATKDTFAPRANKHKINTIKAILNAGLGVIIHKIDAPSEAHAFEMEELLISMCGRADIKTGYLTNMTSGGEGVVGKNHSGSNNPNYGNRGELSAWHSKQHTEETKSKMSLAQKGRIFTEEHKANMRKPKSSTPIRLSVECIHCNKIGEQRAMKRWHFDNCKTLEKTV